MFDLGFGELLVIGIFALIFVGPKDFTKMFRELGRFTAKLRKMARDFQRAMEDAADETGVKETASSLKKMTSARELGLDAVKDAAKGWDSTKRASSASKKVGPETEKLSEERAEKAKMIREASAKKAQERIDAEKAAEAAKAEKPAAKAEKPAAKPKKSSAKAKEAPAPESGEAS